MKVVWFALMILLSTLTQYSQRPIKQDVSQPENAPRTTVRNFELNAMAEFRDETVILGGRSLPQNKTVSGKNRGGGIFVRIKRHQVRIQELSFVASVDEVFFLNDLIGWITSYGSGTFRTLDGGETWHRYPASDDGYRRFFFLNEDAGWYFDNNGALASISGGKVQRLTEFDKYPAVKKLQFLNSNVGWLLDTVNGGARLQYSGNGGAIWKIVTFDESRPLDFSFLSESDGYVLTEKGLSFTGDGGSTWQSRERCGDFRSDRIYVLGEQNVWIFGSRICNSVDGGKTWKSHPSPFKSAIRNVMFRDHQNGWLLAEDGLYFTVDGGRSWDREEIRLGDLRF